MDIQEPTTTQGPITTQALFVVYFYDDRTQGLMHVSQVLWYWAALPAI